MRGHGVDISLASDAEVPTGQAYIFLQPDGQNSIILVGAANHVRTNRPTHRWTKGDSEARRGEEIR